MNVLNKVMGLMDEYTPIFIGDYLDDFTTSVASQVHCLTTVLNLVEEGKAIALKGNHEISYLVPGARCSGWKVATDAAVLPLKSRMDKLLLNYMYIERPDHKSDIVISHAGVSERALMKDCRNAGGVRDYLVTNDQISLAYDHKFLQVGQHRGGVFAAGSIFWCDFWEEFVAIDGLTQVVGHSSWRPDPTVGICIMGKDDACGINIDCTNRFHEFLIIDEDKNITVWTDHGIEDLEGYVLNVNGQ
jgi:hypothetical protein